MKSNFYQVNHTRTSQPDGDKERDQLGKSDRGCSLEDVEILKDVRNTHEAHCSQEPQSYPGSVKVDGDKWRGNGEIVNKGVKLHHEPELVRGSNELNKVNMNCNDMYLNNKYPDEKVDHEKYVKSQINLLSGILLPWYTLLHSLTNINFVSVLWWSFNFHPYFPASMK